MESAYDYSMEKLNSEKHTYLKQQISGLGGMLASALLKTLDIFVPEWLVYAGGAVGVVLLFAPLWWDLVMLRLRGLGERMSGTYLVWVGLIGMAFCILMVGGGLLIQSRREPDIRPSQSEAAAPARMTTEDLKARQKALENLSDLVEDSFARFEETKRPLLDSWQESLTKSGPIEFANEIRRFRDFLDQQGQKIDSLAGLHDDLRHLTNWTAPSSSAVIVNFSDFVRLLEGRPADSFYASIAGSAALDLFSGEINNVRNWYSTMRGKIGEKRRYYRTVAVYQ